MSPDKPKAAGPCPHEHNGHMAAMPGGPVNEAAAPMVGRGPLPAVGTFEPTLHESLTRPGLTEELEPYRAAYHLTPPELRVDIGEDQALCIRRLPGNLGGSVCEVKIVDMRNRNIFDLGLNKVGLAKLQSALQLVAG